MSLEDRISALSARADVLTVRVAKAAAAGPKRPRIPGDGDGDGIPNEGKKPSSGAAAKPAAPKKEPSFIDVLNNPEGRRMVEAIEDTVSSLRGKKGDKILGDVLRSQIKELNRKTGFKYDAADALRDN